MPRSLLLSLSLAFVLAACQPSPDPAHSEADPASTAPVAITGTYDLSAPGQDGELKVSQLDNEMMQFELMIVGGPPAHNQGFMEGSAWLNNDLTAATYSIDEYGSICELAFAFDAEGVTIETLQGDSPSCGFGNRVMADGTYTRTSSDDPFLPAWATMSIHMQGDWRSVDDPLSEVTIQEGQYIDRYNGETLDTRTYTFHESCPASCNAPADLDSPCLTVEGEPQDACYVLYDATADSLRLSMLGGNGQFLTFTRR
ncbi:MAG: hypothetical protein RhofKO_07720 [Rhodothermales bacterium]